MRSSGRFASIIVVIYGKEEMTITYYVGLDVSVESTAVCVIDAAGSFKKEFTVRSYPEDLANALGPFSDEIAGISLESGPMSGPLVEGLKQRDLDSVLMETRKVHAALSAIPVKKNRWDARRIAELLRMGWFQPVHLKISAARDLRLILSARDSLGRRVRELDN